jgi:hypothetical protein
MSRTASAIEHAQLLRLELAEPRPEAVPAAGPRERRAPMRGRSSACGIKVISCVSPTRGQTILLVNHA